MVIFKSRDLREAFKVLFPQLIIFRFCISSGFILIVLTSQEHFIATLLVVIKLPTRNFNNVVRHDSFLKIFISQISKSKR